MAPINFKAAAWQMLQRIEAELRLSAPYADPDAYISAHPNYIAAKEKHDRLAAEAARRAARADELSERRQRVGRLLQSCERWLAEQEGSIAPYAAPRRRKAEGGTVDELRAVLDQLRADADKVRVAPLPSTAAKQAASAWVDEAQAGSLDVTNLIWHGAAPRLPQTRFDLYEVPRELMGFTVMGAHSIAVMAAMFPDEMKAKLAAQIDARADDSIALSVEAKAKKLAQLADEILAVERDECAALGQTEPREDTDPRAYLGCA